MTQNNNNAIQLKDIVILDGARTAIGAFGGSLSGFTPAELGTFVAKEAIVENLASRKRLVLDARSHERFLGIAKEPRDGLRSGHIPHSVSLPFTSLIADGKLKSLECIKDCFKAYESEFKGVITSCGSGVTACILALAATEIGLKQVSVYDGSWTEWGSDSENPIETTSL